MGRMPCLRCFTLLCALALLFACVYDALFAMVCEHVFHLCCYLRCFKQSGLGKQSKLLRISPNMPRSWAWALASPQSNGNTNQLGFNIGGLMSAKAAFVFPSPRQSRKVGNLKETYSEMKGFGANVFLICWSPGLIRMSRMMLPASPSASTRTVQLTLQSLCAMPP